MELWQMRYFIEVYNEKSFSKASRNLYISQQGLSKSIKNIETEFQILLFERTARGIKPTPYGELLFEQSQIIINDYERMINLFHKNINLNRGTISIGMSNMLDSEFFKTIYNFQEKYPDIKLDLIELGTYSCEKKIDDDLIDICFAVKPDNNVYFDFIPVSVNKMILLVNKNNPLSNKSSVKIIDLKNEKFIMPSSDYKIRHYITLRCIESGFKPHIVFTTSQLEFIIELVELNKGIAIIPMLHPLIKSINNNIAAISFDEESFFIEVGFIMKKHKNFNFITQTFITHIKKCLGKKRVQ